MFSERIRLVETTIGNMIDDRLGTIAARCPQWWQAFGVRGRKGNTYIVYAADIGQDIMRCTCPSLRQDTCWHVQRVMGHGCLATPDRAAGPNDLAKFGVAVLEPEQHPTPHLARRLRQRCACGEPLRVPNVRLADDGGRQIVRVVFDDGEREYGYAWAGERPLRLGDAVTISSAGYKRATVVGFGSDWAGPLTVEAPAPH